MRNIEVLHPRLRDLSFKLKEECEKQGLQIGVLGLRTYEFYVYRKDIKYPFSNEDNFFEKVGPIGKKLGLEWGADEKFIRDLALFRLPKDGGGDA